MSIVDILVGIEVALLAIVGLPLSIRGTYRLIDAVRVSTADDSLARAITAYLTLVTVAAIYLLGLTAYRAIAGQQAPDWLRPFTAALLMAVLIGPWWIERATRARRRRRQRDRTPHQ